MNTTTWLMRAADVSDTLSDSVESMGGSLVRALPRLAVAVVLIILGLALGRALRWGSRRLLCRNHTTSFATVMSKLVGSLVVTQDILENTLSGVLMLFRQPFTAGDQIEVQGQTGTVQAITIRETRIKAYDGQLILIPNRDVYKSVIRVQTHYEQRRISFIVGVAYENDAAEACRVIREALVAVPGVATEPAPEALVDQLNVSTVDLEARFWADPRQHESRLSTHEAITAVKTALDEAGIEMPADIVALQATPSFRAALQNDGEITPGGSLK